MWGVDLSMVLSAPDAGCARRFPPVFSFFIIPLRSVCYAQDGKLRFCPVFLVIMLTWAAGMRQYIKSELPDYNLYCATNLVNDAALKCYIRLFYNSASMERERFEKLVAAAVASLPQQFRDLLDNVVVVVEDSPSRAQSRKTPGQGVLLGLYEGVPMTRRGNGYNMVAPDKISIFQKAIESFFTSDAEIEAEVRKVVLHEIAHHFGLDDNRLEQIEAEKHVRRGRP